MPPKKSDQTNAEGAGLGGILDFFKPAAQSRLQTPSPPALPSLARASTPLSSPPPAPSIQTSTPSQRAPSEIQASDDDEKSDGGFSDASLEDLSTLLGPYKPQKAPPPPQRPQHNPYATPRAKRTEVHFHSSPLAFMPTHKFDFKALAKDARIDDATTASSLRAKAAADKEKLKTKPSNKGATDDAFMDIVRDGAGQDARKVLRAVQRTESVHAPEQYCFFDPDYGCPPSTTLPRDARAAPWRLLTQGSVASTEQHLASGLVQTAIRRMNNLPDSLLDWMLDELCIHKSTLVRSEYCNIVAGCPEQLARLVTPERLEQLFVRLGAVKKLQATGHELPLVSLEQEPYGDRDWACLGSFLHLLATISPSLSVSTVQSAMHTLLRMSLDSFLIYQVDILVEFEEAVRRLTEAIPAMFWNSFCLELCTSLFAGVKSFSIRVNALLCLSPGSPRVHDLRQRLAAVFLFGDTSLARDHVSELIALKDFINLLHDDDYTIGPETDFAKLKSCIILFDMAIDDGYAANFDDREVEKQFNDDVDELASRLGEIWRKINDSGMKLARTETKSVVEWVQKRLSHAVRTRKKARKNVFDLGGQGENPFVLKQQQDFIQKFLQPKVTTESTAANET